MKWGASNEISAIVSPASGRFGQLCSAAASFKAPTYKVARPPARSHDGQRRRQLSRLSALP